MLRGSDGDRAPRARHAPLLELQQPFGVPVRKLFKIVARHCECFEEFLALPIAAARIVDREKDPVDSENRERNLQRRSGAARSGSSAAACGLCIGKWADGSGRALVGTVGMSRRGRDQKARGRKLRAAAGPDSSP